MKSMKIHEERRVGGPATPGPHDRREATNERRSWWSPTLVCGFPSIVRAAEGGTQPGAFLTPP
ncbi:MAG TPA: hypothetical protein PKW63_06685, partial [Vicinamibacterales bacterium]|nr:hypothetical protein [Vicinamibacterales bacterium]